MSRGVNPEESILVPASPSISTVGCLRSLGRRGVHTVVASEYETVPAFSSRYCDERFGVPSPHEELLAYRDALLALAERPDVRAILVMREEDAYVLSKYRAMFDEHVAIGWPSFESVRTAQDGLRLARLAREIGVPEPGTRLFTDVDDWSGEHIVKQRYGILTSSYVDFLEEHECEGGGQPPIYVPPGEVPSTEAVTEAMLGQVPIVQERVRGTEYSFRALYDRGDLIDASLKRLLRGETYAGGVSAYHETAHVPRVEEYGRRVLDHLEWHGVASVQFIEDEETGEFKLSEVNPRIWGSILLDMRAGADYPYEYWLTATGRSGMVEPGYTVGVRTHRVLLELKHLQSVLRDDYPAVHRPSFSDAARGLARSLYEQPRFDYLSLDDPAPFARTVLNQLPVGRGLERARQDRPPSQDRRPDSTGFTPFR